MSAVCTSRDALRYRLDAVAERMARPPPFSVTSPVSRWTDTRPMTDDALFWNSPKPPPRGPQPGERVWSMTKNGKRVDAELRVHGRRRRRVPVLGGRRACGPAAVG